MTGAAEEYGYYSSSEEERDAAPRTHQSFASDLVQDDEELADFGRNALELDAEGRRPAPTQSKKIADAGRYLAKMAQGKAEKPRKKKARASPAAAMSKADQFVERCIMMPDAGQVPAEWREIMAALPVTEDPRPHLRGTSHYEMLRSFESM